jgi:lysophospholipase L1-like esterase
MTDNADKIPAADLYVVALGTNDVRYRDEEICAMTSEKYVSKMKELKKKLSSDSPDAEFIFIAPWYSTDGDEFCDLSFKEKTALNQEYSDALEKFCSDNSIKFINPNDYIRNKLMESPQSTYLLDHIHPNASEGVMMYSEAVLSE